MEANFRTLFEFGEVSAVHGSIFGTDKDAYQIIAIGLNFVLSGGAFCSYDAGPSTANKMPCTARNGNASSGTSISPLDQLL